MVLYLFSFFYVEIIQALCSFLTLISATTFINEPLNLAVMSLERILTDILTDSKQPGTTKVFEHHRH
ncbi:olfactory receptor 11A1-like [Arapaima gigas]